MKKEARFLSLEVDVRTSDFRNFKFLTPLPFRYGADIYRIPKGATTDLISSPEAVWQVLPPFGIKAPGCDPENPTFIGAKSGAAHDASYRRELEIYTGPNPDADWSQLAKDVNWIPCDLTQAECDDLIAALLESEGFDPLKDKIVYEVLSKFGARAYRADRAALPR